MSELFCKEEVYDREISPLIKKVIDICKENEIPMLASFNYENDKDEGEGYCTTNLFFPKRKTQTLVAANSIIRSGVNSTVAMSVSSK